MLIKIAKKILGKKAVSALYKLIDPKVALENKRIKQRKKFYSDFINQGDLCFDVGANFGNRTEPLLSLGASVIAVEPQEDCWQYLEKRFKENVQVIKKGLCEEECVRKFYIANASTISSFSEDWISSVKTDRFANYNWNETVDMEMTTLDKLIEQFGKPKFIKIDVEGYELEVLKGLSTPVYIVSFEYTVPEQVSKIKDCINQILKYNSKIKCNFCEGENMKWGLDQWLTVASFCEFIDTEDFLKTSFGDIYIKDFSNN